MGSRSSSFADFGSIPDSPVTELPALDADATLYQTLNVAPASSTSQIKAAYRRAAVLYHPDKCSLPGATAMFDRVKQAYDGALFTLI